ncbi:MAG TPA: radical SAM protein [Roseiflexaceae bacterium]|nr:radical SAM protein [Roseiflexaceae bacterium]
MPEEITLHLNDSTQPPGPRRKVVLYNPRAVFFTMPLGLLAVGSDLDPQRYEVVIVDGRLEDDPVAAVLAQLDDAVCLGVSVLTGDPIRDAVQISRAAKAKRPDLPVIWGGWHPSMFGKECLDEASVDVTVQAQGEETFREIIARLERGESLAGCQGCTFRDESGQARVNPPRPLRNVNTFRTHDYTLLPVERYYALKGKRQLDYISSQGCNFRCAFCADPFVYKRKWVGFEPERVGEEVETLWQRYRFDDLSFQDETFFTRAERVEAIADEFIRRKLPITWAATMRADQGDRLPDEVMAKCKRSGLRRVIIGVESGSQEMMDWIKKDIRLEQVFISAEKCRRHGVAVVFPFIVGFPNETDASVHASLQVAKRLRALSPDFQTPIFYFKPYPGSSITEDAVREGYTLPCSLDEWADFDFIGSAGPWVSPEKYELVERFKFYQQLAWDAPKRWQKPVQQLARWRCTRDFYALPIEKVVSNWLRPQQRLS